MSRDTGTFTEYLETIKLRTNESGVAVALQKVSKLTFKDSDAKLLVDAIAKLFQQGVGSPQEKLKNVETVHAALQALIAAVTKDTVGEFPKTLGADFFRSLPDHADVRLAAVKMYNRCRTVSVGPSEVIQWLHASGGPLLIVVTLNEFVGGQNTVSESNAQSCVQALSLMAVDLQVGEAANTFRQINAFAMGTELLRRPMITESRALRQLTCNAIANLLTSGRKFAPISDASVEKERELANLVTGYIKEALPTLAAVPASEAPTAELRVLINMCCNSRRKARLIEELGAHKVALGVLQIKARNSVLTATAWDLLSNIARKQMELQKSLVQEGIGNALRESLTSWIDDTLVVSAVLRCALNLTSSNAGRSALHDIEPIILSEVMQKYSSKSDVVESCLGILGGLCTRSNTKSDQECSVWYDRILQSMHNNSQHVGCVRRGLGALVTMLMTDPESKRVLADRTQKLISSELPAFRNKHTAVPVIASDVSIIMQMLHETESSSIS